LFHALGLIVGIVLAITILKLWPRLEASVPRWFRAEVVVPQDQRYYTYLAWTGGVLIILLCTVFVDEIIFASVMVMGLVGGAYLLFRAESQVFHNLPQVKKRLPWMWEGGGWRPFLVLFIFLILLVITVSVIGAWVGSNEDPVTHEVKLLPTLALIIPSVALAVQFWVMLSYISVQGWRAWMGRRQRKGKTYGRKRSTLLRAHPASLAYYILMVDLAAGAILFTYTFLLVMQAIAEARSQGLDVGIDVSGALLSGQALDYLALVSFVVAWVALLVNLSGKATRVEGRFLNRRVFASLSVFFVMVLFMHVIVARGDEFTISVAFRAMYLFGIAIAPAVIIWHRWTIQSKGHMGSSDQPTSLF
jgi:hypothetical protein